MAMQIRRIRMLCLGRVEQREWCLENGGREKMCRLKRFGDFGLQQWQSSYFGGAERQARC